MATGGAGVGYRIKLQGTCQQIEYFLSKNKQAQVQDTCLIGQLLGSLSPFKLQDRWLCKLGAMTGIK